MKRWLVTGTRYGRPDLFSALDRVAVKEGYPCLVVVGDCRGVDMDTQRWCKANSVEFRVKHAEWDRRKAGLERNARLVAEMKAGDLCLAFPHWTGSEGTTHCVNLAQRAGLRVLWLLDPTQEL